MYQARIRNNKSRKGSDKKRDLAEPEEGQDFALVRDLLGNGRVRVLCSDKNLYIGRIRGSMRKYSGKVLIERGDIVLIAKRDFGGDQVDVFLKYTREEVGTLVRSGILPEVLMKQLSMGIGDEEENENATRRDDYVMFVEEGVANEDSGSDSGSDSGAEESDSAKGSDSDELDIDAI